MRRHLPTVYFWALVAAVALAAVVHSLRASAASVLYYQSRYRHTETDPTAALDLARRAHALYPHNYLLCISASKRAFYAGRDEPKTTALMNEASHWTDLAFALCPFNSEAVQLKTELLSRDALPQAIALWEGYRDRVFWEPFNHWVMLDLYARAGAWDKATETLYWLKDTPFFKPAEDLIRNAQRSRGPLNPEP